MIYSKVEMYDMLIDLFDLLEISEESLDIMLKLIGDSPQSYVKILNAASDYKTFKELEDNIY